MLRIVVRRIIRKGKKKNGKTVLVRSLHTSVSRRSSILRASKCLKGSRFIFLKTSKRSFSSSYRIHPAIGIARLGDSASYYDEPTTIGGLPTQPGTDTTVTSFRDTTTDKKLLRQASVFKIYGEDGNPINLQTEGIKEIVWSVWLANKKSAFYEFRELQGNPLLNQFWDSDDPDTANSNTYEACGTPKRNADVDDEYRQGLIVDFGPRSCSNVNGPNVKQIDVASAADEGYQHTSYPSQFINEWESESEERIPKRWLGNATDVTSLGSMEVSEDGVLRVIAGNGSTCGKTIIDSFAGGGLWWDDICDGPVRATIKFNDDREDEQLTAWCMIGSPKYAPELVNISTMDDVTYDAAVRYNSEFRNPVMVNSDLKFNLGETGFKPIFSRDIKPILERMKGYDWVANVAPMVQFANPPFDVSTSDPDIIAKDLPKRKLWFSLLRQAFPLEEKTVLYRLAESDASRQILFGDQSDPSVNAPLHFPLMPLNSGDNSVMDNETDDSNNETGEGDPDGIPDNENQIVSKFATVTPTQYYFLYQWSHGFVNAEGMEQDSQSLLCNSAYNLNALDQASGGNCVGYPTSPGVETTWNIRVPWIYEPDDPYRLRFDAELFEDLFDKGLTPLRDECLIRDKVNISKLSSKSHPVGKNIQNNPKALKVYQKQNKSFKEIVGIGLEPGDLTKRMAIPWQADYANCSVQSINFTDPDKVRPSNKPAYYTYWWPPQAPWNVYLGYEEKEQQEENAWGRFGEYGSGQKVFYQRGIMEHDGSKGDTGTDVYTEMINHWQHLGFIVNTSGSKDYPYFVEAERTRHEFAPIEINDDDGDEEGGKS